MARGVNSPWLNELLEEGRITGGVRGDGTWAKEPALNVYEPD